MSHVLGSPMQVRGSLEISACVVGNAVRNALRVESQVLYCRTALALATPPPSSMTSHDPIVRICTILSSKIEPSYNSFDESIESTIY